MAFQSQVYVLAGEGIQGTISRVEPVYGRPAYAGDVNVVAGKFVFDPSAGADGISYVGFGQAAQAPAGLAIQNGSADDRTDGTSLGIGKDTVFFRLIKGYAWTKATTAATVGQKVLVVPTTGVIATGASAGTGQVDTGWVVTKGGAAGSNIEIAKADIA